MGYMCDEVIVHVRLGGSLTDGRRRGRCLTRNFHGLRWCPASTATGGI